MPRLATALLVAVALVVGALPVSASASASGQGGGVDPTTRDRPTDRGPYPQVPGPAVDPAAAEVDHLLVKFADQTSAVRERAALDGAGATGRVIVSGTDYVRVRVGTEESAAEVLDRLAHDPSVVDVQLDHVRHAAGWTDDPGNDWTWPYLDLVRLPRAWDVTAGQGAVVAVLDTGVDAAHEDLAGRLLPGKDFVDGDSVPQDPNGHGTTVAGLVAANGNNGLGGVGAAYAAKVLPVRVLDADGAAPDSRIAAGIAWAAAQHADVINLSLAGPATSPVLLDAIRAAITAGSVVVAAAGDSGTQTPQYPAAYAPAVDGLVAVSATDDDGAMLPESSWGDDVTLAAPGSQILGPAAGTGYQVGTGTSFAAPLVSGVAALVSAHSPALTPAQLERRLVDSAREAGPRGTDPFYGAGLLDAAAAVTWTDAARAAPAVALDRVGGDGRSNDTRGTATPASFQVNGTLAPEGDVDWYRFDGAAGWSAVQLEVDDTDTAEFEGVLSPVVEVRDGSGAVLRRFDGLGQEYVWLPAAGPLFVRVTMQTAATSDIRYGISVGPLPAPAPASNAIYDAGPGAMTLATGDVTGDGRPDVLVGEPDGGIGVLAGSGDGRLSEPMLVEPPPGISLSGRLATADLDGDGRTDVLAGTWSGSGDGIVSGVLPFLQRNGELVPGTALAIPGWLLMPVLGDLDGDHDVDVLLSAVMSGDSGRVALNDGHGVFSLVSASVAIASQMPAVGDVTGDGRQDIADGRSVFRGRGDGTFEAGVVYEPSGRPAAAEVRIGDVTGDGRADAVSRTTLGLVVGVQRADGGIDLRTADSSGSGLVLTDANDDGRTDVVGVLTGWQELRVSSQLPDGTLGPDHSGDRLVGYSGSTPAQTVQAVDLDGDGSQEIVVLHTDIDGAPIVEVVRRNLARAGVGVAWVKDVTPAVHASGVGVRPTVRIALDTTLRTDSLTATSVRLVDAAGATVTATRTYSAADRTISLTPSADLQAGLHYEVVVDGLVNASGVPQDEPFRSWFTVAAGGSRYTPVEPLRVLDTRDGTGMHAAPHRIASGEQLVLDLHELADRGATAVVLNVTAASPAGFGNVRVYPYHYGATPPGVSNVNVAPGIDQPNLVTVPLGDFGYVDLLPSGTSTHLIADLQGYYAPGGATAYEPLAPQRLLDTRSGTGVRRGPLVGGSSVDLRVTGVGGVPADAVAVVLNVTATQVAQLTHVRVYPAPADSEDQTPPDISNLNLTPGRDQPNLVTVPIGDAGRVRFYLHQGRADLIADIAGYYAATGDNGFVPVAPTRVVDTRSGRGIATTLHKGTVSSVKIAGAGSVPAGAVAAVLNVTGVQPRGVTHVRAFPTTSAAPPDISTINLVPGRDEANLAVVPVGLGGAVSFYPATADVDLVVDVAGYFAR